jgi:putative ABC transport system ATP-binding protein
MLKNTNKTIIEALNLKKSFLMRDSEINVLKGINIKVKQGEFAIIFGPSGCGKSTFLHSILGLEPPTSGQILVEGKDFYKMNNDERAVYRRFHVGMVFQQPLWISALNIIENVSFPLHLLGLEEKEIIERAKKNLMLVGMDKWAEYMPSELSGGQQQKVTLARALSIDPLMIIADEPTGNLDTVSGRELLETFLKLVDLGKTIIMVTHDLEYLKYATKIYHMLDGEVVEEIEVDKKSRSKMILGKKEIGGAESNVRDRNFLKKIKL